MNVAEVIEELKKQPQDAIVLLPARDGNELQLSAMRYKEEWCSDCNVTHKFVYLSAYWGVVVEPK